MAVLPHDPACNANARNGRTGTSAHSRVCAPLPVSSRPADPEVVQMLAEVGIAVCVGAVALAWVAGALYNAARSPDSASHAPRQQPQILSGMTARYGWVGLTVLFAVLAIHYRKHFDDLVVGTLWVRIIGLAILAAATVFTLWARLSIGTMWTAMPRLQGDHQLRTHGPYGVTRHPIYTGGLGMLLGITLLAGIGQWVVLFPGCLIVLEVKIRIEEHLLVAAFPDEYPRYRHQVPQIVPGLYALRQRTHKSLTLPTSSPKTLGRRLH
jgi:protein-S-isoprenylcysteine O-methyltransferase Ste14